ncbi:hypothetical protein GLOIN_2v1771809 [Rhizophagus irregularis DAOM 181602=DAOM 197198]|uniref:Uncharacterized protein n=1 Tax=Rhizophagus irregularis (strain DAOM 181602 / DAOM 197198 / MUCL 43194) TaxID=747089 RepID=A0A2P4Q8P8_RHIID|nr:hypothetical protein GLOIN_2v1771809 [Rhizophagus irregularis DAOM 181602=DAOM 197198]POG74023.1 hypothetical protein GLOIN_2v1771809 [Rhizophagus irregularis DAOM 181602=DAOM 197198]GBC20374.2 hypothetical protein GLOIN_2v1771809 [Rhizophagus irregularis DAOM 181602=DAOM 197198]|eukprot:XP_025180889.1 hypothetical protein GLOIN_2v1771809 [Rhizophagus irregularis DAOM 181602=DAOM 197198]
MTVGEMIVGETSVGEIIVGEIIVGEMIVGEMIVSEMILKSCPFAQPFIGGNTNYILNDENINLDGINNCYLEIALSASMSGNDSDKSFNYS